MLEQISHKRAGQPITAGLRVLGKLKLSGLCLLASNKDGETNKQSFTDKLQAHFTAVSHDCLNPWPTLNSQVHLVCVKSGEGRHWPSPFWIYQFGASERIKETLIARCSTYPCPQLDVQPCAVEGKCLSEGHQISRAVGRLRPGSVMLTQLPGGLRWSMRGSVCLSAQMTTSGAARRDLPSATWPSDTQQPRISATARNLAFVTEKQKKHTPNCLFTLSSARRKHWLNPDASSWGQ